MLVKFGCDIFARLDASLCTALVFCEHLMTTTIEMICAIYRILMHQTAAPCRHSL